LRYEIEAAFSQGLPNTPMAGSTVRVISGNFLTARPVGIVDGVDFQHSGLVRKVDTAGIMRTLDMGALVLLSPFGFSPTGEAFNLTMEEVATSSRYRLAGRQADFPDRGARHPHPPDRTRGRRQPDRHRTAAGPGRTAAGSPAGRQSAHRYGVLPAALRQGLQGRCGAQPHHARLRWTARILLEVYVHDGIGTMVVDEKLESLREATADDVGGILQLIEPFEKDGTLVQAGPHRNRARRGQLHGDRT